MVATVRGHAIARVASRAVFSTYDGLALWKIEMLQVEPSVRKAADILRAAQPFVEQNYGCEANGGQK